MPKIIRSAEGKEIEATDSFETLMEHSLEDYDFLRIGAIDVNNAIARAALVKTIITIEMLRLKKEKMLENKITDGVLKLTG